MHYSTFINLYSSITACTQAPPCKMNMQCPLSLLIFLTPDHYSESHILVWYSFVSILTHIRLLSNIALTLDCMRISHFVPHTLTKTWTYRIFAESVHSLSKKPRRSSSDPLTSPKSFIQPVHPIFYSTLTCSHPHHQHISYNWLYFHHIYLGLKAPFFHFKLTSF